LDLSIVCNENSSKILLFSGWALGPGNMSQNDLKTTSFMTSLTKYPQPPQKIFFQVQLEDWLIV